MPVYVCPVCGFRKTAPEGSYYHAACGPNAIMIEEEEYKRMKSDFAARLEGIEADLTILVEDLEDMAPALLREVGDKIEKARSMLFEVRKRLGKI